MIGMFALVALIVITTIQEGDAPFNNIYQAAMLDPHTAAELSLDDIIKMCDELIEAHGVYMAMYDKS